MENIFFDFELLEQKEMNFSTTLEELLSLVSYEGRDLENQLESTRSSIQTQLERLMERENEIQVKESQFESLLVDLQEKKLEVESLDLLIYKKRKELAVEVNRYNSIQTSIMAKEVEFERIEKSVSEATEKLDLLEKSVEQKSEEAVSKSKELYSIRGTLKMLEDATHLKEKQLNEMQKSFEGCSKELELKEDKLKQCQSSIDDCEKEIKVKEKRLDSIQNAIVECSREFRLKEKRLDLVRKELEVIENQYNAMKVSIEVKEVEFSHIRKSILEASEILDLLEKSVEQKSKESGSKSKELESTQEKLKKIEDAMQLKERQLNVMQKSFEFCTKEFELKDKLLKQCQSSIDDCDKEIEMKRERLYSIQTSIVECSKKLEPKQKRLELVRKLEEQNLKSMKQHAHEFEVKEQKFESLIKDLEPKEKFIESKLKELDLLHMMVSDCLKEAEWKEKNSALLQGLVEKRFSELEMKKREFERREDEFQLVQTEFQAVCNVQKGPDVAKSIQNLIQMGETIHAVSHICALKLTDKFSPIILLTQYLEDAENMATVFCRGQNSSEAKEQAKNKELAALRAVMECMKVCNLKSEFLSTKILKRIGILEKKDQSFGSEAEQSSKRRKTSLSPRDQPPPRQDNFMSPLMTKGDNVWTKTPEGFVKLNFGFVGQADCGFLSVVACDHNAVVLAIWCRKILLSDPLVGEALAAHGALSRAASSGWSSIILEGDSEQVIHCLQRRCEPSLSTISRIVSDSVALLRLFECVIPVLIPREANSMARKVSQWAAGKNVQVGLTWMSVPSTSSLFSVFC